MGHIKSLPEQKAVMVVVVAVMVVVVVVVVVGSVRDESSIDHR